MPLSKHFYYRILICLIGIFSQFPSFSQDHLLLPVDFMIENGNFSETVVVVKKDGATVYTVPGKDFMKVKLQFNEDYILSFSKPGYITKSIAVNTNVPPERMSQAFEPYKIGVKLFRQYEGVNIVVYNQPVARIYFNPSLDDFDYDVDYTKSILSILKKTEDELMQKAADERAGRLVIVIASDEETASNSSNDDERSGQMSQSISASPTATVQQRQQAIQDPRQNSTPTLQGRDSGSDPVSPITKQDGEDPNVIAVKTAGEDKTGNIVASNGETTIATMKGGADEDFNKAAKPVSGSDKPSTNSSYFSGEDAKYAIHMQSGQDAITESAEDHASSSLNKFIEVEKNRTITTFRITKGLSIAEYRKVDYSWGGVFYFRDGNYAISRSVFHWATGAY